MKTYAVRVHEASRSKDAYTVEVNAAGMRMEDHRLTFYNMGQAVAIFNDKNWVYAKEIVSDE